MKAQAKPAQTKNLSKAPVGTGGTPDFRLFLQETLVARCKTNPSYSLRAFARSLGLEPSFLSKLLSGKRVATARMIEKIANRLSLDPSETRAFVASVAARKKAKKRAEILAPYHDLAIDQFAMIADWYHYAILELIRSDGFQDDPKWIAKRLGIQAIEARSALERLERLEMISRDENGKIAPVESYTTVGNDFTAAAFRKLQAQILRQALQALEETPIELRDQSSMTMAIDPELLPEAKKKIRDFRRELCAFLQSSARPKTQVYQLSTSLFPVTDRDTE